MTLLMVFHQLIRGFMIGKAKCFRMFIAILFAVGLKISPLQAECDSGDPSLSRRYNLSICAIFKNEARYLREWIEYHRVVGVDHFYLYDNGSKDQPHEILRPYVNEGVVTLVNWPDRVPDGGLADWALSTQLPAYENAAKYKGINDTQWLAFIDVGEYLVPVNANTVSEVLQKYNDYPGLQLTADCFDASQIDALPRRELLIATADLTVSPPQNIQKSFEKIIFKPQCHTTFTWPPFKCDFRDNQYAAKPETTEIRINRYVNRFKGSLYFGKHREKLQVDSRLLSRAERKELLEIGFDIEDKEKAISRFEPELRKRMGLDTGWRW